LTAFGCTSEPEPTEPAETKDDAGATSAEPRDLTYLTGTWTVTTELVEIDEPAMTPAADQPGTTWKCVVDGENMTLTTDRHEYTGSLTPMGDNGWVYEATATFTDEDGYTWTSTIMVNGSSPAGDDDTFSAAMSGSIDSDAEGHLYTARWTVEGARQ
ncbi:MAG: hypothetical protein JXA36_07480, partial [Coriobacteriia bacterium]|nr:hypothetical protein [Coriobacteriia bacterium]